MHFTGNGSVCSAFCSKEILDYRYPPTAQYVVTYLGLHTLPVGVFGPLILQHSERHLLLLVKLLYGVVPDHLTHLKLLRTIYNCVK